MRSARENRLSCLNSNAAWRREAAVLQNMATNPRLSAASCESLLREAGAADRQADWWLNAAIEDD
jgi:hypothetical protein